MNKKYIDKHEAYLLLKHKAETYMLPATKEAYEKAAILIDSMKTYEVQPVKRNDWISITDELPEPNTEVLVYIKYPQPVLVMDRGIKKKDNIKKLFFDGEGFTPFDYGKLSHWMPLPEPPKESDVDV